MIVIALHPHFFAEKQYVFTILLGEILGLSFEFVTDEQIDGYRISLPNGNAVYLQDVFWKNLKEGNGYDQNCLPDALSALHDPFYGTPLQVIYGTDVFEQFSDKIILGADVAATVFFMLTRWEEYVRPEKRDLFGRYPGSAAMAHEFGFLERPVVNEWAEFLFRCLVKLGLPETSIKKRNFETVLSCDVDHPRLWWSKLEMLRTIGGAFLRKNTFGELQYWWKNWLRNVLDPFDTFDELMILGERHDTPVQFNFLSERPRHYDAWYNLYHPEIIQLMQRINERGHIIGFHPSREAAGNKQLFLKELDALRKVSPQPVVSGRHHYLCFESPATWRYWEDAGLQTDSTAGYSDLPGFRCGICQEFPVFDFLQRRTLNLREQPLVAMDVTFARYLNESPDDTLQHLIRLQKTVQHYHGQFTILWHNSSLNTWFWAPYRPVFEQILA